MAASFKEWPNTLYRWNAQGECEGRTFKRPEDVPEGEGWARIDDLGPAPAKKEAPAAKTDDASAIAAGKRLVAAERENAELREQKARLVDTVKLYEDFLNRVKEDEGCPDGLRLAIVEIMGGSEEAQPAKKSRKKRSA